MPLTFECAPLTVEGVSPNLPTIQSLNSNPLILFLHGFDSSKKDIADLTIQPSLKHHGFITYDAPDCGHNLSATDIPFLVATAETKACSRASR
ncbi:hypothetical protein PITC_083200 [Penicillium italicum]|uniref:Uncharacterized protein n=1 Tax=Penicillium italicum TaxID=40296 RepID=A0A0A2L6D1_PENIT|nr:hypothetical protein PITC_083200 [Penicillium italicum]